MTPIATMCRACNTRHVMEGSEYCRRHGGRTLDRPTTIGYAISYDKNILAEQIETLIEQWRESVPEDGWDESEDSTANWDYEAGIIQGLLLAKDLVKES